MNGNYLVADASDKKATDNPNLISNFNTLVFTSDNAYDYNSVTAGENNTVVDGTNKINQSKGSLNQTYIDYNGKVVKAIGAQNSVSTFSIYDNDYLIGARNAVSSDGTNTGNINKAAISSNNVLYFNTSSNIKESNSVLSEFALGNTFSGVIDTHYFLKNVNSMSPLSPGVVKNVYGLYMDDMNFGKNLNYAIYTNAGLNSFGDNIEVRNNGYVKANRFISASTTYPDYVFDVYYNGASKEKADYNFKSLDTVESFIKENGHLPGYTSAKEVAEAGQFDMTATQLTNVEKIEELYLHTIEQEKKIKKLESLVEQLLNK